MKLIRSVPLAVSGLALALASLGNLLLPRGEGIRFSCGILSAVILCAFFARFLLDFDRVKEELKNPVALSVLPTATMALMLLCVYAKPFVGPLAVAIWYAALTANISITLLFARRYLVGFKLQTVFPSWFVVFVGIVVASLTSPAMGARQLGQVIFCAGFFSYLIALPVVIYRMKKLGPLPEAVRPTLAIITAPMSLCITGYLAVFDQPNVLLVKLMLIVAVINYIFVSGCMVSLLRLKFYPTYAAFTFPYVISAVAFKSANVLLVKDGLTFFSYAPIVSECVAILAVAYVLLRYAMFLTSAARA